VHPLSAPGLMAAALLAVAGAQKVVDPTMTIGALRALRAPAGPWLVRTGAAAELALGVVAIVVGGRLTWSLVALSYLAFTAFVMAALRRGTMVGSCGCFGRADTPPHASHVVVNLVLAGVAGALAGAGVPTPLDGFGTEPTGSGATVALATVGLYLLHAVYVDLPRNLAVMTTATATARP